MNQGQTVFAQVVSFINRYEFNKCVSKYKGNHKVRSFTCWEQYLVMCFAQLTYRDSLRDIESCLGALQSKLYHSGIKSNIARSTLADANEKRDWRIYADFAQVLIKEARALYKDGDSFNAELSNIVYAFDSTLITLCLSLCPWANYKQGQGAVKLHTLMDLKGSLPTFIHISDGLLHDTKGMDLLPLESGSFYIFDRGYLDWERLYKVHQHNAFFIIRAKDRLRFRRVYSSRCEKANGIGCDQSVKLGTFYSLRNYPDYIRRIVYRDAKTNKKLVFLTNHFSLKAHTVADLYRQRWQIELFFKWIKQHLKIKSFYGTSSNAVYTQIWIAISIYVLIAIINKKLKTDKPLYTILQILSLCLFEKTQLNQLFEGSEYANDKQDQNNQLKLFTL